MKMEGVHLQYWETLPVCNNLIATCRLPNSSENISTSECSVVAPLIAFFAINKDANFSGGILLSPDPRMGCFIFSEGIFQT